MEKLVPIILFLLLASSSPLLHANLASKSGTLDGSEQWGYVQVRPKAHLFWWLYKSPYRVTNSSTQWPIILWLQGGPGGSGTAFGNFLEIGPLDSNLNPRNSTWLHKADLLFVDSPVATGFSFVEDMELVVRSDEEAATDLTTLLKELFNGDANLQKSPLYIFSESYGGKFALSLGVSALKAIEAGELKIQLGGVALGDSWISPEDFVFTWGPLLKDLSRIDNHGLNISNSLALKIQQHLANGQYEEATTTWSELENAILDFSNNVDFYNFMLDFEDDPVIGISTKGSRSSLLSKYGRYLETRFFPGGGSGSNLYDLMNGPVKNKLKIIPKNVTWGGQDGLVFPAFVGDFMKPRIQEADELLAKGIRVTIYNGQLDLICSTKGAEAWLHKLKWDGFEVFNKQGRTPLYCKNDNKTTRGFTSSYKNLSFYWILGAGHFVSVHFLLINLTLATAV